MRDLPTPSPLPDDETLAEALRAVRGVGGEPAGDDLDALARIEGLAAELDASEPSASDVELLADLGAALADVEAGRATAPKPAVLAAARAALARSTSAVPLELRAEGLRAEGLRAEGLRAEGPLAGGRSVGEPRLRVLRAERPRPVAALVRAAAAALVVGVGLTWLLAPRGAEARSALTLAGVDRYATSNAPSGVSLGGRLEAQPGTAFLAGRDEVLALRLVEGGRVVLRSGERLEVAALRNRDGLADVASGALLSLEGGEVLLACEAGAAPEPISLLLRAPGSHALLGLLTLRAGAAHVAQAPGRETRPAVALADASTARFTPFVEATGRWGAAADLRGPVEVLLEAQGVVVKGEPARTLFADLERFGGPLLERPIEPFVSARQWRVVEGRARRVGGSLSVEPSTSNGAVVLAWRPDDAGAGAGGLRLVARGPRGLALRAQPAPEALPATGRAVLPLGEVAADPGLVTLELPLASARTQDGELRLEFVWPEGVVGALHFDGAFLTAPPTREVAAAKVSASERGR